MRELREQGLDNLEPGELVKLRDHVVDGYVMRDRRGPFGRQDQEEASDE